ncbi:PLP-dependent aminotransferase family protein [Desulfobacter curvatus]|uniref:aminotransferase-like domain-containing protein n=1 Tax=Desulfobacter curvatus TaxID=2290 RepID=UPI00037AC000|nr:PLP-dependent aminotransferase family protein [Desulfobacter curvatus]
MAIWTPDLTGRTGPKYRKLADAIADAVAKGELRPGTCLPPHRILAYEISMSANTTSRAYAECVKTGLLCAETGRGTFVRINPRGQAQGTPADLYRPVAGPIDFSSNLPFPGSSGRYLAHTLGELSRSRDLQAFMDYQKKPGLAHHLAAGTDWLAGMGVPATAGRTIVTCGAQHGIMAALMAATRPGDLLLTEALTYAPVMAMASRMDLKIRPIAMDENGILPDALASVCRSHPVKAVYLTPTIQTPTTATLDSERRKAVAGMAKTYDFILIEDDVYGPLRPDVKTPIAAFSPEHTVYISSTSKCLAPGLRVAFLYAPEKLVPQLSRAIQLSCWMPPPLMVEIVSQWLADGTAEKLKTLQYQEAAHRQSMAGEIFSGQAFRADPCGFHVWLPLPSPWETHDFCRAAADQGIKLAPGSLFATDGRNDPGAVRISLSHEPDRERVRQGVKTLAALLQLQSPQDGWVI